VVSEHFLWPQKKGNFFFFLQGFKRQRKKRVATFWTLPVAFCAEFDETGCRSKFLLEKQPLSKKSFESEFERTRYQHFKNYNFSRFSTNGCVILQISIAIGAEFAQTNCKS
jgi:hypothetical protein